MQEEVSTNKPQDANELFRKFANCLSQEEKKQLIQILSQKKEINNTDIINGDTAIKMLENRRYNDFIKNIDNCRWLNEVHALKMIKLKHTKKLCYKLSHFERINKEVVLGILRDWDPYLLLEHIIWNWEFEWLKLDKEVFLKFLELAKEKPEFYTLGRYEFFELIKRGYFDWLDKECKKQFIERFGDEWKQVRTEARLDN